MTVRSSIDALIRWYETNAPVTAGRVLRVDATANTVRKFARKTRGGPYMYRGREIVPARKPRKELEREHEAQRAQQLEVPQ